MDTRSRVHESSSLATWTGRTVALHETPAASITLGPDAWAIVVALAGSTDVAALRVQLGWSPDRLVTALVEIEDRGVLEPGSAPAPAWRPPPPPPAPPADTARAPVAAPSGIAAGHHTGPLAPPPPVDPHAQRRRALPGRRSSGT
jgi:hypothetical protein